MEPELAKSFLPETERKVLTKAFFNLVKHWELSNQQQANLLGWNYSSSRTKIDAMRRGKSSLENDMDKINRVVNLVNVHKCLRVLFPANREEVYSWVKIPRERFGNHSVLDIMIENGSFGIAAIRQYLEHERTR